MQFLVHCSKISSSIAGCTIVSIRILNRETCLQSIYDKIFEVVNGIEMKTWSRASIAIVTGPVEGSAHRNTDGRNAASQCYDGVIARSRKSVYWKARQIREL